jgi:predicted secreted protein
MVAIYALFWVMSIFLVLPFGVRTDAELGRESLPGHAESAPHSFSFWRMAFRVTILATAFFALFYANYVYGWVDIDTFDFFTPKG